EGLLERRMMPLFIRLPRKLKRENPNFFEALEWNTNVITSHYDIHRTIFTLIAMQNKDFDLASFTKGKLGQSLFDKLPERRTCEDAHVAPQACPCNMPIPREYMDLEERQKFESLLQVNDRLF